MAPAADSIDLEEILEKERVVAHFQPWVSLKKRSIVGFEGLCRGTKEGSKELISPLALLKRAEQSNLLIPLDRLFRKKVLEGFASAARENPDLVLSINFDTSVLNDDENALDDFITTVKSFKLKPSRIAIEILESKSDDLYRLKRFIENQRKLGFLIALDDIGAGYSNLERIAELKPDLIKIDRALVMGLHQSYHKQQVFTSMVRLAHSLGALLLAEGAETEAETMRALELGADMIQGYYFSRPQLMREGFLSSCEEKIDIAARKFKSYTVRNINLKRSRYQEYDRMMAGMAARLADVTPKAFDARLKLILAEHPELDCLYVLDEAGTQLSHTVGSKDELARDSVFFRPARRGADHSLKNYYQYLVATGLMDHLYVSTPYLSLATGKLCVTLSALFRDAYGRLNILCVDVKPDPASF
jgi:EAL domain-containing protein (putative c-di-GMP-specific phosphodiesterase class I)